MCIFLDLHDLMGDALSQPLIELKADVLSLTAEHQRNEAANYPFVVLLVDERCAFKYTNGILAEFRKAVVDDSTLQFSPTERDLLLDLRHLQKVVLEKVCFLERHPLRCGTLQYDLRLQIQHVGILHETEAPLILLLSHLYVLGRLLFQTDPWPDMELVLWRQNPDRLFFGGRSRTVGEAYTKYRLALGASAADSARDRKHINLKIDHRKVRRFSNPSLLAPHFVERMGGWIRESEGVSEMVRELISAVRDTKSKALLRAQQNITYDASTDKTSDEAFGPLRVIEEFQEWAESDGIDTSFDWFKMIKICTDVWTGIIAVLQGNGAYDIKRGPLEFVACIMM